ncbi:MAG TPA: MotA/TolQ/ExbB proton channel family protein [Halothiobacillus sp.]|nr:MotA/TolQ/ExbB proton channel family protein [Halothiobacillus sp.]
MNLDAISHAAQSSGGILYLMVILLFVALTVALERSWYLRNVTLGGKRLLAQLDPIPALSAPALQDLAINYKKLPFARMLTAASTHDNDHHFDRLADILEESMMKEAQHTDRMFWVLDTIITLAPLLGLLGTIIGMFNAFQVLSGPNTAPTQITGGVAEALLATASGLFVAMVGLVFFNGLNTRVRHVFQQMEILKTMLINRIYIQRHTTGTENVRALRPQMAHQIGQPVSQPASQPINQGGAR